MVAVGRVFVDASSGGMVGLASVSMTGSCGNVTTGDVTTNTSTFLFVTTNGRSFSSLWKFCWNWRIEIDLM